MNIPNIQIKTCQFLWKYFEQGCHGIISTNKSQVYSWINVINMDKFTNMHFFFRCIMYTFMQWDVTEYILPTVQCTHIYLQCMCCVYRYKTNVLSPELPFPWTDGRGAYGNVVYGLYHWHVPLSGSGSTGRCWPHSRSSEGRYLPWWPPKYSMWISYCLVLTKWLFIFNLGFLGFFNWGLILNASNLFMNFHHP